MTPADRTRNAAGFTLVEVLVAVTLGLFVIAGMIGIFVGTARGYREDHKAATIADELTLGMAQLTEDVEMAGFWGTLLDPNSINVDSTGGRDYYTWSTGTAVSGTPTLSFSGTHCGAQPALAAGQAGTNNNVWTYDANVWSWRPVSAQNNLTSATPSAFPCIADAQIGTDVLGLMRVNGGATRTVDALGTATGTLTNNRIYLRSNNTLGALYRYTTGTPDPPAVYFAPTISFNDWEYRVSIYYVRNFSVTAGDGIPSLCRKYLSYGSAPAMDTECFAQGVENLQVEYGIDEDAAGGNPDGVADLYVSAPSADQMTRISAIRIWLLARSVDLQTTTGPTDTLLGSEAGHDNTKTYTLAGGDASGGKTITANDSFLRKLSSSTVLIRNPSNLRAIR